MLINLPVLVLNQNYEPLNVCRVRRAMVLIDRGKAEILENGRGFIRTPTLLLPVPSVIRLIYLIKRPRLPRRLTRREVFLRDHYTCQYCGRQTRELTLDHVLPRHRGGQHRWENLVSACKACNHHKAGRTPQEAGMKPLQLPVMPSLAEYYLVYQHLESHHEWRKYVPGKLL
ncbi:MAG: HNH endonuclease [Chloroflexota bacterium]|nr:HNH endonuclease [Chloroflexota bacterium]